MTPYQFTEDDYASIVKAVRDSNDWIEDFDDPKIESVTLDLKSPNVLIGLTRDVTYDGDRGDYYTPACPHVIGDTYTVTSFEYFDADDNDQPSDFDARRLCEMLNWTKNKRRAA